MSEAAVLDAAHANGVAPGTAASRAESRETVPASVAIVAMGKSRRNYIGLASQGGSRFAVAEETWAINGMAGTIQADRVFAMDDLKVQEIRAEAQPDGAIPYLLDALRDFDGPVYTSRAYPDYPNAIAFPLAEVLNTTKGPAYFNNTVPYAIAYALMIGVEEIHLYGCDYGYRDQYKREKGRACTEFWLGLASARGVRVVVPADSTLLDAGVPQEERIYGYDSEILTIRRGEDGDLVVDREDRMQLPTAEEMERRYSHTPGVDDAKEEA